MKPLTTAELAGWVIPAAGLVVGVVLLVLAGVFLVRATRAAARKSAAAEVASLRARIEELEASSGSRASAVSTARAGGQHTSPEYVITSFGGATDPAGQEAASVTRVELSAPAFADAVLRESVVQTASFLYGVRRAFSAESRDRIAWEMRREVRRSRKSRKAETKEALREYRARRRAEVDLSAPKIPQAQSSRRIQQGSPS